MNRRSITLVLACVVLSPPLACAERWQAPDGFLSVERPDPGRYVSQTPRSPPELVRWQAPDESIDFSVDLVPQLQRDKPTFERMVRAYGHKGVTVERLPIRKVGEHEIWVIKTSSDTVTQLIAVIHHDKWFHRVRASGLTSKFDLESARQLIKSIEIKSGSWMPPSRNPSRKVD